MNKNDSRYFTTATLMDEAFLRLFEKKDFEYITVKEICKTAGVNRSTFYLHYENVGDLLAESVRFMLDQFMEYFKQNVETVFSVIHDCSIEELYLITPEYLIPYLTYIKTHKRLFKTVIEKSSTLRTEDIYERMFRHVFTPILERVSLPKEEHKYIMSFYIRGLMGIVAEWLKNDCSDEVDHVVAIIQRCVGYSGKEMV